MKLAFCHIKTFLRVEETSVHSLIQSENEQAQKSKSQLSQVCDENLSPEEVRGR